MDTRSSPRRLATATRQARRALIGPGPISRRAGALVVSLAAALLVAAAPSVQPAAAQAAESYIVVLRDGVDPDAVAREHAGLHGFRVKHVYRQVLSGYSAPMGFAVAERLKLDPRVRYTSPSRPIPMPVPEYTPLAPFKHQQAPTGVRRIGASTNGATQTLDNNGDGVGVVVMDSGIELDHPDLKPVEIGKNCDNPGAWVANDTLGHGTHVAGIIAARDNGTGVVGVAPGAKLFPVKIMSWEDVICGVEWVTVHAQAKGIRVVNMSFGVVADAAVQPSNADCSNGSNDPTHTAICNSVKAGVAYVAAAGNSKQDAGQDIPAAYAEVITVSGWSDTNGTAAADGPPSQCKTQNTDETWYKDTSYGPVVDIAAPAVGIRSTYLGGGYVEWCGTSMAAPHVAGAAALLLKSHPNWSPATVKQYLLLMAKALPNSQQHSENLLSVGSF